jgi:hypothetical protein
MTTTFEDRFTQALHGEAAAVREPGPEFFTAVSAGVRRRRRRRVVATAAAVACAVAVATGGMAVALSSHAPPLQRHDPATETPALPPADPGRVPDWGNLPDVGALWPGALHRLPGRLPDGSPYVVEAILPGNRYVVLTWTESLPAYLLSRPAVFDPDAGTLTSLGGPDRAGDSVIGVGIVGDLAVWVNRVDALNMAGSRAPRVSEVWTAALAGGPAQKIANVQADTTFTIAGDYVMWDRFEEISQAERRSVGIYRVPVSGGQPELVPGTAGFAISYLYAGFGGTTAVATNGTSSGGVLLDLVTGNRYPWTLSTDVAPGTPVGTNHMHCGLVGCTGEWGTLGPSGRVDAVVQDLDGSHYMALGNGSVTPVGIGRYVLYRQIRLTEAPTRTPEQTTAIWDRVTGRAASLYGWRTGFSSDPSTRIPSREAPSRPFVTWGDNGTLMLLDLQAIA